MRTLVIICGLTASLLAQVQNRIVSAGYEIPTYPSVAPGQVITLFVRGLNVPDAFASGTPLPTTLSGITVRVKSSIQNHSDRLPIFSVRSYDSCSGRLGVPCPLTHVTVQIPTDPTCVLSFPNDCASHPPPLIVFTVEQSGVAGDEFPVFVTAGDPHILNTCDTIFGTIGGPGCYPVVARADGNLVGPICVNPAKPGESIVIYAVGLGGRRVPVMTAQPASSSPTATHPTIPLLLSFRLTEPPGSPAPPAVWSPMPQWVYADYIGLVPGYVGLYQINFTVPATLPPNLMDSTPNMRIQIGSDGLEPPSSGTFVDICVRPQ